MYLREGLILVWGIITAITSKYIPLTWRCNFKLSITKPQGAVHSILAAMTATPPYESSQTSSWTVDRSAKAGIAFLLLLYATSYTTDSVLDIRIWIVCNFSQASAAAYAFEELELRGCLASSPTFAVEAVCTEVD